MKDGKEVTLHKYDEDSHLLEVTNSIGRTTKSTYKGDGKRIRMDEPRGATIFIYDGNDVLAGADATGAVQTIPASRLGAWSVSGRKGRPIGTTWTARVRPLP
jgi:YD repeat-containing protein